MYKLHNSIFVKQSDWRLDIQSEDTSGRSRRLPPCTDFIHAPHAHLSCCSAHAYTRLVSHAQPALSTFIQGRSPRPAHAPRPAAPARPVHRTPPPRAPLPSTPNSSHPITTQCPCRATITPPLTLRTNKTRATWNTWIQHPYETNKTSRTYTCNICVKHMQH
jgi:hypothetical protein